MGVIGLLGASIMFTPPNAGIERRARTADIIRVLDERRAARMTCSAAARAEIYSIPFFFIHSRCFRSTSASYFDEPSSSFATVLSLSMKLA